MSSRCQAADVINISAIIAIAEDDLRRIRRYVEKQLDNHRDVAAVAASIIDELDTTRQQLERAAIDCRGLAAERDQPSLPL